MFTEPGICPHCNMKLIKQSDIEKMNQTLVPGELKINYEFLDEESLEKEAEFTEVITKSFTLYKDLFGGNPRDSLGATYTDFTITVSKSKDSGGEADPKSIQFKWSENKTLGKGSWKTVLMHELFHLWNGETIRYKNGEEHWFNEGFSEFYSFQTAVRMGIVSPEEMLATSALSLGYYSGSKGLGNISMREAGIDDKTKFENFFLVYHGGWITAMVLDVDIRTKTDNEKSLDDLMKWLYANFLRTENLYDTNDIINGIIITTGLDYTEFFNTYIYNSEAIPVSNYLDPGKAIWDYKWNEEGKPNHKYFYKTLGIDRDINIQTGSGSFFIEGGIDSEEKTVKVYYHRPENFTIDSEILLVIPGAGRNGDSYRNAWIEESEKYGLLILSPMYPENEYGFDDYHLGGLIKDSNLQECIERVENSNKIKLDEDKLTFKMNLITDEWIFNDFDRIFDLAVEALKSNQKSYDLFGHSAGGHILHRFALFQENSKAGKILASNASFYTLPKFNDSYPFGLKDTPVDEVLLKNAFRKNLIVLLGELDNENETGGSFLSSPTANLQGLHRLERGKYFYEMAKAKALEMKTEFNWEIKIIPNVGHNHRLMGAAAGDYLYK
ncbi:hypothetical protein FB2170_00325 [Maribacter sp. HTCC2170]|nr:hypothetical protein FB2170_00325 [Maribacter sp. HTCC2170]